MTDRLDTSKGFTHVDQQADPGALVAGMDATAQWPAVRKLREWERAQLSIGRGDQILDVGCGAGDVVIDLAGLAGPEGHGVGVDASEQMLAAARERAAAAGVDVTFEVGDATALRFEDNTFDAIRSERTLQWVDDPAAAVGEMLRVARPGARICITDTDWASLLVDHPSPDAAAKLFGAMEAVRGDQTTIGRRLVNLIRDAGAVDVTAVAETHLILQWDPDAQPQMAGFFPIRMIADDFAARGLLSAADARAAVDGLEDAGRRDRLFIAVTMFAAAGTAAAA